MGFYDEMQDIATELLTEFDQGGIFIIEPGVPNTPRPGASVPGADVRTSVAGTAIGVNKKYVDNSLVISSDKQFTMSGSNAIPSMSAYAEINGERFKIVKVDVIPAAGTPVAIVVICGKR